MQRAAKVWARVLLLLAMLGLFFTAIQLMGDSFKMLGREEANRLFRGISNPFAALCVGILATAIVQSSSVTTSTIVALVGSGQVSVEAAVPMVMGANIGTTITATLVSIGHVTRGEEFRRAFAGATMHDFFNLLSVVVLLPVELATGFLATGAHALTDLVPGGSGGGFESPLKTLVGGVSGVIERIVTDGLRLSGWTAAVVLLGVALAFIVVALTFITKTMRKLIAARLEHALNDVLGRRGLLGMAVGLIMTVAVQSSSITTSMLVPLMGAGILSLESAYPITLGANLGTTVTALLACLAAEQRTGLTIALVHSLFNAAGILLFYPVPALRRIPLRLARGLADLTMRSRLWVVVYIGLVFILIPLLGMLVFR